MTPNIANSAKARARKFLPRDGANVVATAHTPEGLQLATQLQPGQVDVVELRIDALLAAGLASDAILAAAEKISLPRLITVRHPDEGGIGALSFERRQALYVDFLPLAQLIDIELRSAPILGPVLQEARQHGVGIVFSFHDFQSTPGNALIASSARASYRAGAHIFKVATLLQSPADLARLLTLLIRFPSVALMGMGGALGMASRLALATSGSLLNYGYLQQPNAPGQWEACELRDLLDRMAAQGSA